MFCKYCGKQIPDHSRFCRFCGKDIAPAAEPPVIPPDNSTQNDTLSGTVPVIPDLSSTFSDPGTFGANYVDPGAPAYGTTPDYSDGFSSEYDVPPDGGYASGGNYVNSTYYGGYGADDVGSYEDIMKEFGTDTSDDVPPLIYDVPPAAPAKASGTSNKKILVLISAAVTLVLLSVTVFLCIKMLVPDPEDDPIVQEHEHSEYVSPSPSATPTPSPSPTPSTKPSAKPSPTNQIQPQISPPKASPSPSASPSASPSPSAKPSPSPSATPTPAPSATPKPTPTPAPTPTPVVNNTVVGYRYVDYVPNSIYLLDSMNDQSGKVLATIPVGTKVDFVESYVNGYSRIRYNGTYGYSKSDYLSQSKPNLTVTRSVYVANVDMCAYFRTAPAASDSNVLTYVYLDQELGYIETTSNGYMKVKYGDYYGYVHSDYISSFAPNTTVVSTKYISGVSYGAYLLYYPAPGSSAILTIPVNTPVDFIQDQGNGYCKVSYNGYIGYVLKDYLSDTDPVVEATEKAHNALLGYTGMSNYCFIDINGDGVDEMLACDSTKTMDGMTVSNSAPHLYVYKNGSVSDKGVLGDSSSTAATRFRKMSDGTYKIVTESADADTYICTIYTLGWDGTLSYDEWRTFPVDGVTKYYLNQNGFEIEMTQADYDAAVTAPSFSYVEYQKK